MKDKIINLIPIIIVFLLLSLAVNYAMTDRSEFAWVYFWIALLYMKLEDL